MRAIVKPQLEVIYIEPNTFYNMQAHTLESINEDEWDAEIYALILWYFWND
jgi:hypothetical protein